MKVSVKVKPGSRQNRVSMENGEIVVRVTASAQEGKANDELIRYLANLLDIPKSRIEITGGRLSPYKRLDLPDGACAKLRYLAAQMAG